jgi:tRNA U55 pseudouridine synthase TruB
MIVDYYKNIGESMSDVINRFKIEYNLNKLEKVAFAGRLDPLAHGIVRLLTHNDKIYKDQECNHNKIYTYSVIESFQTDTYDIMGLINGTKDFQEDCFDNRNIVQEYPKYSSKTINIDGKMVRLWDAAKNNLIKEDTQMPTKDVTIFFNKKESSATIHGKDLLDLIISRINMVQGDFRQKEIIELWEKNIDINNINKEYKLGFYRAKISSGGYVRSIAHSMNSTAFDIYRVSYE